MEEIIVNCLANNLFSNLPCFNFIKCHVLGNDFVLIDDFNCKIDKIRKEANVICSRKLGIGADDLIIIKSDGLTHFMEIINPDGSKAELCGNALSCATAYLANKYSIWDETFLINTDAGSKKVSFDNHKRVSVVNLGQPIIFEDLLNKDIQIENEKIAISHLIVGVPHTIIFMEEFDLINPEIIANFMYSANIIPYMTNVMYVKQLDTNKIFIKCWERGGSGYTLACGTGAAASVVCGVLLKHLKRKVSVNFDVGVLNVEWLANKDIIIESSPSFNYYGFWPFDNAEI